MPGLPKPPKQTLAFFSISVAWIINGIIYSIYQVFLQGISTDVEKMLAWSAMFAFAGWLVFIIYPLSKLKPGNLIFNVYVCPIITGLYAVLIFSSAMLAVFEDQDLVYTYLPWAATIGVIFGLTFSLLLQSEKLPGLLKRSRALRSTFLLSPLIFVAFFYILLPTLFPATIYRFMPEIVQHRISARLLQKVRVGDRLTPAIHLLLDDRDGPKYDSGGYEINNETFTFKARVKNDTIISVQFQTH